MSALAPGQPVTVHIGGVDNDPTGHQGKFGGEYIDGDVAIKCAGGEIRLTRKTAATWVVPVTPPCPFKPREVFQDAHGFVWRSMWTGEQRDELRYFDAEGNVFPGGLTWSDIAVRGPFVRLIPAQPARKPLIDDAEDHWWPIEGTDKYARAIAADVMTRERIEDDGPVREVSP